MTIEQKIAAKLMQLVTDRAYPLTLPQNTDYPAITWHRVESRKTEGQSRAGIIPVSVSGRKTTYQIVVWARRYSDCVQLLRQCKAALEQLSGVYLDDIADGYEYELKLYTVIQEYVIWNELEDKAVLSADTSPINDFLVAVKDKLHALLNVPVSVYQTNEAVKSVVIDIADISKGEHCGDESYPLQLTLAARCIDVDKSRAAYLAACALKEVEHNKWGKGHLYSFPQDVSCQFEFDSPDIGSVWRVQWRQILYLSDVIETGVVPAKPYFSTAPEIGKNHESDYEQL